MILESRKIFVLLAKQPEAWGKKLTQRQTVKGFQKAEWQDVCNALQKRFLS